MLSPTPQNLKKLEKLAKVLDGGDVALLTELNALEDRLEGIEGQLPALREAEDGYTPKKGVDYEDGKDYVLTEQDKKDIAKSITVPIVEKVIIKEVPGETIREIVKQPIVTNEIVERVVEKEVATLDDAIVGYLEGEIKRVEDSIPEVVKQKETNFGFVIRDVVAGTGVTIDKSDPNRPIVSAEAVAPTIKDTFGITVDGAGIALTTGTKGSRYIEQDCTITGWSVVADQTGSIIFDVKRAGVSLAGTEKPTLTASSSTSDLALSTWTTSLTAGDIIEFVIDSASTLTRATLTILITKT